MSDTRNVYLEYDKKRQELKASLKSKKVEELRAKGFYSAEDRLRMLFDNGDYTEMTPWIKNRCLDFGMSTKNLGNEGVITSSGEIDYRPVYAYSNDSSIMGGSLGEAQGIKIGRLMDLAMQTGAPVIGLNDAAGARIQEGVAALHGYCATFGKFSIASGWIPQISIILGTCAGGTAYAAALTDFIIMVNPRGKMFITGPAVIKSVTGEEVSFDQLGGSGVHSAVTGTVHFVAESEQDAMMLARYLLSFLPSNSKEKPPSYQNADPINRKTPKIKEIVPDNQNKAYDMKEIIQEIVDNGDFLEVQKTFAQSMIIGFARMNGESVGIVANQPKVMAGCIDINAAWKAARFVRFCDSFNIPLITFADCPGYLPGIAQEHNGIIRNGSKMLFAYSEATVPKITVVVRKDYGGAYSAMCGKGLGADLVLAFPTAELAVMGAEGAASILFKNKIEKDPDIEAKKTAMVEEYKEKYLNPYRAAEYGIVDDVIDPADVRERLISGLKMIKNKAVWTPFKKHSNIPL